MSAPTAQEVARRLLVLRALVAYAVAMPPQEVWQKILPTWPKSDQEEFFEKFKELPKRIAASLRSSGIWEDLSPAEDRFLHAYPQDLESQDQLNMSWRAESAAALKWALGLSAEFPPFDQQTEAEGLKTLPSGEAARPFIASARLRPPEELEEKRSLAELWHWRSRPRQLIEERRPLPRLPDMPQINSFDDIVRLSAKALKERGGITALIDEDFPAKGKAYRELSAEEWAETRSLTMERHFAMNWVCGQAPDNRWDETPTPT
jgi:hypothetical protein